MTYELKIAPLQNIPAAETEITKNVKKKCNGPERKHTQTEKAIQNSDDVDNVGGFKGQVKRMKMNAEWQGFTCKWRAASRAAPFRARTDLP